jgi:hypothetical protein
MRWPARSPLVRSGSDGDVGGRLCIQQERERGERQRSVLLVLKLGSLSWSPASLRKAE